MQNSKSSERATTGKEQKLKNPGKERKTSQSFKHQKKKGKKRNRETTFCENGK